MKTGDAATLNELISKLWQIARRHCHPRPEELEMVMEFFNGLSIALWMACP
ncbi:hypothetical protein WDV93_01595 [Pantoea ananatis]